MIEPGRQIGRYEIQRRLGRGGMGTVYLAHDPMLKRSVAIKLLLADLDLPDARERFVREARSAAALNHANIVTVHELGEVASQPYIVMEYVLGDSLAEIIARKAPVALLEKLRWIDDLCAGVAFAHEMRVLHRDLKPTNLMIDRSGRLKIVDFGIARMLGTLATAGSALGGTPGYMAPEQIRGQAVDTRSDIFSIGAVCYELLGYTEAFPGDSIPTISYKVLTAHPHSLAEIVPDIDPELVDIVDRALAKDIDQRFPDAASLRSTLAGVRRRLELTGVDGLGMTMAIPRPLSTPRPSGGEARPSGAGLVASALAHPSSPQPRPPTGREQAPTGREQAGPVAQAVAALARARALLQDGDLDGALNACEQALAFDDAAPEALEVERAIRAAAARRRAQALLLEGREFLRNGDLDEAQTRLEQARGLDTELGECARLESDLRLARLDDPGAGLDADATVIAPARGYRRTDLPAGAGSPPPHGTPVQLRSVTPVNPSRATPTQPVERSSRRTTATGAPAQSGADRQNARPGTAASPASASSVTAAPLHRVALAVRRHPRLVLGAIAGAGVVVVGLMVGLNRIPPSGIVVIDAVPWGLVTAIRGADGASQAVPGGGTTPLVMTLPEGMYVVTVTGPGGTKDTRNIKVEVTPAVVGLAPIARFPALALEDYFDPYLAAPSDAGAAETVPAVVQTPVGASVDPPAAAQSSGASQR
jgi:hypothetical protein